MKQVIQNFKTGELKVEEVPAPVLKSGGVLVSNAYSLISSGTERSTVSTGQSNLLSKAIKRPELVNEVIQNMKREGMAQTYHKVMNRLDSPKALGYSSAGMVLAISPDVGELKPGDRVACAGAGYACHAEVVFVPKNLCVPIPQEVDFKAATFSTLGAIALQSVRQAEVTVGDYVVVIGLGLVGLLTVQILKACGCQVIGLDLNPEALTLAKDLGADEVVLSTDPLVEAPVVSLSGGYGADRVIIAADTTSNQPVELAGKMVRDRGTIVIVGAVKIDIPRNLYYEKELNVRLSRSYGPGRYDMVYEERGVDYPIGYVRWTEKRNMAAFLQLMAEGKINVAKMVSHVFPIEEALEAYALITGKTGQKYSAILLDYNNGSQSHMRVELTSRVALRMNSPSAKARDVQLSIGFIGAGNFAQSSLLPHLKYIKGLELQGVATARGMTAHSVARKYGFAFCTTDNVEILQSTDINCVFIATRHDLHAELVVKALHQNKHVFVEKPLALSEEEVNVVIKAYDNSHREVMVGYNRRFSNLIREAQQFLHSSHHPIVIHYRVNAPSIPRTHWTQDPLEGGGRILGEVCHFVDVVQYLTNSEPVAVYAESISSSNKEIINDDNINITIKLSDGSLGIITYVALGDARIGKEYIEIFGENSTVIIDDFRKAYFYSRQKKKKLRSRGKGHQEEVEAFVTALKEGQPSPIPFKSLILTSMTTLRIRESLKNHMPITIESPPIALR